MNLKTAAFGISCFFSSLYFVVAVSLVGIVCLTAGCGPDSTSRFPGVAPEQSNDLATLRRGIGGDPSTLDPEQAIDTNSFEVIRDIYEGLTSEDPEGKIVSGVAESWIIDEAGKTYVFNIRKDAKWSNGEKLGPNDFVYAWRRLLDPATASPAADLLRPIKFAKEVIAGTQPPDRLGVEADGEFKLVVRLEKATPYFLQILAHPAAFPVKHPVEASSGQKQTLISNGPFTLQYWIPGHQIKLLKNQFYWAKNQLKFDAVIYTPISDEDAELGLYRGNQLDVTSNVPISALERIRKQTPMELHVHPFLGTYYYAFNLHSKAKRLPISVRKALAMAINREELKSTLLTFGQEPAYSFVPPGTWNFKQQNWEWKDLNESSRLVIARQLYKEAGYSENNPLKLRLLFNTSPALKRIAIATAAMWSKNLGVKCDLADEEYRVFLESRKSINQWDVIRLGWTADFNDAANFLDVFRSDSRNNDPGYSNSSFDGAMTEAADAIDQQERRAILERAEQIMLRDYPIIPVYFYSTKRMFKPNIKGEQANPLNRLYSKHLYRSIN